MDEKLKEMLGPRKPARVRTSVSINFEIYDRAKAYCDNMTTDSTFFTFSSLVDKALEAYLDSVDG